MDIVVPWGKRGFAKARLDCRPSEKQFYDAAMQLQTAVGVGIRLGLKNESLCGTIYIGKSRQMNMTILHVYLATCYTLYLFTAYTVYNLVFVTHNRLSRPAV